MTAERSLRRTLHAWPSPPPLLRTNNHHHTTTTVTKMERQWWRRRLSDLILGTSIWRRRHAYVYYNNNNNNRRRMTQECVGKNNVPPWKSSNDRAYYVRALVDLHAAHLKNPHENNDDIVEDDNMTTATTFIHWPEDPVERLAVQQSFPTFLIFDWVEQYGLEATKQLCRVSNRPGPVTLRRNRIQCPSTVHLCRRLNNEGVLVRAVPLNDVFLLPSSSHCNNNNNKKKYSASWKPPSDCVRLLQHSSTSSSTTSSIWSLSSWKDGWFEVQDVGSQLIVQAMQVQQGETVVDYCAGNGGKTLALISALHCTTTTSENRSRIYAHDVVPARLAQLRGSLKRVGFLVNKDDSRGNNDNNQTVQLFSTSQADTDFNSDMADVVLVDAPCSSTGVLRRRPSQRWLLTPHDLHVSLPKLQLDILTNASRLVRPGGRLVYATCSLSQYENQNVVRAFESRNSTNEKNNNVLWDPWDFDDDANVWPANSQMESHTSILPAHCRQLLPHVHDSDGFFVARWKKRSK